MLEIQTKTIDPDIVVLELTGRITMGRDSKQLEWAIDNLIHEQKKKVVFDLTGVTHIDSTGVGIIVMSAGQLKQVGRYAASLRPGTNRRSSQNDQRRQGGWPAPNSGRSFRGLLRDFGVRQR